MWQAKCERGDSESAERYPQPQRKGQISINHTGANGLFGYVSTGTQVHQNRRTRQVVLKCFSEKVTSKYKLL